MSSPGAINTHDAYIPCHIQPWSAYAHHILYMLYMFLAAHEVFVSTSTLPPALSVIFVRMFFSTFLPHFPRYKLMSIFQVLSGLRSRGLWSRVHRSIGPSVRPSVRSRQLPGASLALNVIRNIWLMGVFPVLFAENFAFC